VVRRVVAGLGIGALVVGGLVVGCESGSTDAPVAVSLEGGVQKGPFVLGSSISVSPLNEKANPTGQTFLTQTTNDKGEFAVDSAALGPVSIQGEGFYFDEVKGSLSVSQLTLRALYLVENAGPQNAFLNLITHLTYARVRKLVLGGSTFPAAILQAEKELRSEFAITPADFDPGAQGIQMNLLGGDTPANRYLLAASAVLLQAAGSDAGLQELANTIATNLEEAGKLSASSKQKLMAGLLALDAKAVMANLQKRLDDLGSAAVVPDIERVLDTDQDGVVDASCPRTANPQQDDTDGDTNGDACDACPMFACADAGQAEVCQFSQPQSPYCYVPCGDTHVVMIQGAPCPGSATCDKEGAFCREACDPLKPKCPTENACTFIGDGTLPGGFACVPPYQGPFLTEGKNPGSTLVCGPGLQMTIHPVDKYPPMTFACRAVCDLTAPGCAAGTCTSFKELNVGFSNVSDVPDAVGVCIP